MFKGLSQGGKVNRLAHGASKRKWVPPNHLRHSARGTKPSINGTEVKYYIYFEQHTLFIFRVYPDSPITLRKLIGPIE